MAPALLDLHDSNVQILHKGEVVHSPGYALLDGAQYTFGTAARGAARLRPRDINNRYWWHLNTEGLQPALGPARHTADLVHAHLLDIHAKAGKPEELILAVPGSMERDQLALLLGIIEQCPFNAVGLVNRSTALASTFSRAERLFHLEIQLHQAVVTELTSSGGEVQMRHTTPLPGCGLLPLQERLVEIIAAAFIRQTRFDPRRKAESEQQLYDALPAALLSLSSGNETNVEVMGYRARISPDELQPASELLLNSVSRAVGAATLSQTQIILDPLAGLLPGLLQQLPHAQLMDGKSVLEALEYHAGNLVQRDEALSFVTSLPCKNQVSIVVSTKPETVAAPAQATAVAPPPPAPLATHLLVNALAAPLSATGTVLTAGWELYLSEGSWLARGEGHLEVNGIRYQAGQVLHCGDHISAGTDNFSAQLIAVAKP